MKESFCAPGRALSDSSGWLLRWIALTAGRGLWRESKAIPQALFEPWVCQCVSCVLPSRSLFCRAVAPLWNSYWKLSTPSFPQHMVLQDSWLKTGISAGTSRGVEAEDGYWEEPWDWAGGICGDYWLGWYSSSSPLKCANLQVRLLPAPQIHQSSRSPSCSWGFILYQVSSRSSYPWDTTRRAAVPGCLKCLAVHHGYTCGLCVTSGAWPGLRAVLAWLDASSRWTCLWISP